jgi:hypothetical protein
VWESTERARRLFDRFTGALPKDAPELERRAAHDDHEDAFRKWNGIGV